jgi:hypothetical protein
VSRTYDDLDGALLLMESYMYDYHGALITIIGEGGIWMWECGQETGETLTRGDALVAALNYARRRGGSTAPLALTA